jgi:hypothetical protein
MRRRLTVIVAGKFVYGAVLLAGVPRRDFLFRRWYFASRRFSSSFETLTSSFTKLSNSRRDGAGTSSALVLVVGCGRDFIIHHRRLLRPCRLVFLLCRSVACT